MLGLGGESMVFALDEPRVLRVPRGQPAPTLEGRQAFLADLEGKLPFRTPLILEIGLDHAYTIEARLPGRSMLDVLRELRGPVRARAWRSYITAVDAIGTIPRPDPVYRQILASDPIEAATWPDFIAACMAGAAQRNRATIEREIGDADRIAAQAIALTADLEREPPKVLVHGDVFPGNVMMDDAGAVTAVIDFGYFTVAGDPTLDLAAAYLPLEMLDVCGPDDIEVVRDLMVQRHGAGIEAAIRCHRAYFALFMADPANAAEPYPRLYRWSLTNMAKLAMGTLPGF